MGRLLFVILVAAAIVVVLTYVVGKLFRRIRWIKYTVGIVAIAVSLYFIYLSRQPSQGLEDLGQFIIALILFPAGIIGIITAFIMDHKNRKR